jgi:hypothetical protein
MSENVKHLSPEAAEELLDNVTNEGMSEISEELMGDTDCPHGCYVEPDGYCPHGYVSAAITAGVI